MQKRLLILCDGFCAPGYGQRMAQLCKHLTQRGWEITVMTEQIEGETYVVPDCQFYSMPYYQGGKRRKKAAWLSDKLFDRKDSMFHRFVRRQIRDKQYDIILCSTFNEFPLRTARLIAKETGLPLMVDLRDIIEQWGTDSYMVHHLGMGKAGQFITRCYQRRMIRKRNKTLRKARMLTTVSDWHSDWLAEINEYICVIYNGYDEEVFYKTEERQPDFIISYIGRIYDLTFRNPLYLLQAVAALLKEGKIDKERFRLVFHIEKEMCEPLRRMAEESGVNDICNVGDYIPREEAQTLLRKSAISVVLVQEETEHSSHGIMTTKFFEAVGCEKPIICTPATRGCLANTIRHSQAGIASHNVEELKAFIMEKYREWEEKGYTQQTARYKERYSRQEQASEFEEIMLSITDPCVSVIVPIYNAERYLERCLSSIAEQSYKHLQVILVDDGSTDRSKDIAQSYVDKDKRFQLISQKNSGQAKARNTALTAAKGEYVSFVDADDYLAPDFYERLLSEIDRNDVVQFGYTRVDKDGHPLKKRNPHGKYQFTTPWSRLYRRDFIDFNELSFPEGHIYEDAVFSLDLWLQHPKIRLIRYNGYHYRMNPTSTTAVKHDTTPLFDLIKERFSNLRRSKKDRRLIKYTLMRLKLHFLLGR